MLFHVYQPEIVSPPAGPARIDMRNSAYDSYNIYDEPPPVGVFVDGELHFLTRAEFAILQETAAIEQDAEAMASIRRGVAELDRGLGVPLDQVRAELGL